MADKYVYNISRRYLQKWLRYDTKHVKNRHFSRPLGPYRDFPNFIFDRFWRFDRICMKLV